MSGAMFAAGYDNAAGLATLDISYKGVIWQPRITGLQAGRRIQTGDRLVIERGTKSGVLRFGFLRLSQYTAFLTQTGLDDAISVECTLALPNNDDRTYTNYNAVLVKPDVPSDGSWYGTGANPRAKLVEVGFPILGVEEIV